MPCKRISYRKNEKERSRIGLRSFCKIRRKNEEKLATAVAAAVTRRRQDSGKRTVFVKAEQKRDDDGQAAAAENVGAEEAVLRAENEQRDKNPKGNVTLIATSHK